MSTIADRIKEICAQKGTSMYKLEKQLNLGNGTIGKWGKNGRQPTYDKAVAVTNALGVSADYLLTGEQKEKPVPQRDGLKRFRQRYTAAHSCPFCAALRIVGQSVICRWFGSLIANILISRSSQIGLL